MIFEFESNPLKLESYRGFMLPLASSHVKEEKKIINKENG